MTVAAGAAAYGLLCLGGSFSDRLDVLTHFAPFALAGAAVVLTLAWLLARGGSRLAAGLLGAFALLSTGALVVPELATAARPQPAPPSGADRLRLLQFNLRYDNADPAATARYILSTDADIVFLEEATQSADAVASLVRAAYPYQASCDGPGRRCGTRVLSRRAPLASGGYSAPHGQDGSLGAAWMTLPLADGGTAAAVATHYTWPIPAGPQQAQSRALTRFLQRFPPDTLLVAGDFNSTPWSWSLRRQDRAFSVQRRTRAVPTWPARLNGRPFPLPVLPIDHVYAGRAWSTVAVRRGPRTPSDHYPVVVELARTPLAAGDS